MDFLSNLFTKNTSYNPNSTASNRWVPYSLNTTPLTLPSYTKTSTPAVSSPIQSVLAGIKPGGMSVATPAATQSKVAAPVVPAIKPVAAPVKAAPVAAAPKPSAAGAGAIAAANGANPAAGATGNVGMNMQDLALQAGKAGLSAADFMALVGANATQGTEGYQKMLNDLGIPGLVDQTFSQPEKTTQALYNDAYNSSGLATLKGRIGEIDQKITDTRLKMTQATKEHYDNPWVSASTRSARIAKDKELYLAEIQTYVDQRTNYASEYDSGVSELEKMITRVGTDQSNAQALNAGKLNYLLNEAEKKSGLAKDDATKEALRYVPDFLKSTSQAKLDAEQRKYQQDVNLIKIKEGLSGSGANAAITAMNKAVSNNPGANTYLNAYKMLSYGQSNLSDKEYTQRLNDLSNALARGDTKTAQDTIKNMAFNKMSAEEKSAASDRFVTINSLTDIQSLLDQYAARSGDTNLAKGTIQTIAQKAGTSGDPELAKIGTRITQALQVYRNAITGAAWGEQETAEYKQIFPSFNNTSKLNTAIISGMIDALNQTNRGKLQTYAGLGDADYNAIFGSPASKAATMTLDAILNGGAAPAGGSTTTNKYRSILDGITAGGSSKI